MSWKGYFSKFLSAQPGRLHFAAHSHHPWPDVSFDAHQQAWLDAADLMDDKWAKVFVEVIPETQSRIASLLMLPNPTTLAFAPNTHELLSRIFSCLPPPVRILTTDGEFHSFTRQARRWEEAGLAVVERVSVEPFVDLSERLQAAAASGRHQLVFFSHVLFDSGFVIPGLVEIVAAVPNPDTLVVIDGYHGFLALPTDLGEIAHRAFYLAGGYKYAMSGEGSCFLHCPPGYLPRPVNTGWLAGFSELESRGGAQVAYRADGSRFFGATFDPSGLYRLNAALALLDHLGLTVEAIHRHVGGLQEWFLSGLVAEGLNLGELIPDSSVSDRGHFLTFRSQRAEEIYRRLHDAMVIADYRGDRLRIGFGIYHDPADIDELLSRMQVIR